MKKKIHNRTKLFINGVPAVDIARQHGIKKDSIYDRLKAGWDLKKACTYKHLTAKQLATKMGTDEKKIYSLRAQGYTWEELEDMANGRKI